MLNSSSLVPFQGHVVTNYHVIAAATKTKNPIIKVKLQGMEPLSATIVGYEPEKDLAVLRISTKNLPTPISVGSSNDLQVGQNVLAIGKVIVLSIPFLSRRCASPSTLILKLQPLRA
jgi:S1-C subfamily serine protease